MNARANLITVTLALSLIGPAVAGAQIPRASCPTSPSSRRSHLQTLKANSSTDRAQPSGNWAAYVHGGSSQKVAKAITAAATTRTANAYARAQHVQQLGRLRAGGSSQKVAKAITAAATTRTASTAPATRCAASPADPGRPQAASDDRPADRAYRDPRPGARRRQEPTPKSQPGRSGCHPSCPAHARRRVPESHTKERSDEERGRRRPDPDASQRPPKKPM